MSPGTLLKELRARGIVVAAVDGRLHVDAPKGVLTAEVRQALATHKPELVRLLSTPTLDTTGELAAVKLRKTAIGDCWLVADADALVDHPDILRSGLPVFWFEEIAQLQGKSVAELRAIGIIKSVFPTGRVLQ